MLTLSMLWPGTSIGASTAQIQDLVTKHFGPSAHALTEGSSNMPRYLWLARNGFKQKDLAVPIHVDGARGQLSGRSLNVIPLHGTDDPNGAIGNNCLGLAVFQMSPNKPEQAERVHFLYECFSGYAKVSPNAGLVRKAGVRAAGDAVQLNLETGAQLLVYWDGNKYSWAYTRSGD
jgi:hypothetical protein